MPDPKVPWWLTAPIPAPRDNTRTRPMPRPATIGPAPSEASQARTPRPKPGVMAAVLRSMLPSADTPGGMLNEMVNPLRQGAQAREALRDAVAAIGRRDALGAVGAGVMAAMSVPGVPGDELAKARAAERALDVGVHARPYFNVPDELMGFPREGTGRSGKAFAESRYPYTATVMVRYPATKFSDAMVFTDEIKGMNLEHALERARRNWPGSDVTSYAGPLEP